MGGQNHHAARGAMLLKRPGQRLGPLRSSAVSGSAKLQSVAGVNHSLAKAIRRCCPADNPAAHIFISQQPNLLKRPPDVGVMSRSIDALIK